MCQELEPWCNEVLSLCSQQNAFTQSRLHTQGGHEYVHSFFAPEDTSLQTDSPRINRASVARMQSVSLPSDTSDVDSAMTGMLKLLPNVTQELLLNYKLREDGPLEAWYAPCEQKGAVEGNSEA